MTKSLIIVGEIKTWTRKIFSTFDLMFHVKILPFLVAPL